jgi:hypothetical protein
MYSFYFFDYRHAAWPKVKDGPDVAGVVSLPAWRAAWIHRPRRAGWLRLRDPGQQFGLLPAVRRRFPSVQGGVDSASSPLSSIPRRTGRPTTATGRRRMVRRPGGGVESASSPVPSIDRRRARPTTATGRRRTVSRSGSGVESPSYPLSSISRRRGRPMTATGRRRMVSSSGCGC